MDSAINSAFRVKTYDLLHPMRILNRVNHNNTISIGLIYQVALLILLNFNIALVANASNFTNQIKSPIYIVKQSDIQNLELVRHQQTNFNQFQQQFHIATIQGSDLTHFELLINSTSFEKHNLKKLEISSNLIGIQKHDFNKVELPANLTGIQKYDLITVELPKTVNETDSQSQLSGIIPQPAFMKFSGKASTFSNIQLDSSSPFENEVLIWLEKSKIPTLKSKSNSQISVQQINSEIGTIKSQELPTSVAQSERTIYIFIDTNFNCPTFNPSYYEIHFDRNITIKTKTALGAFYAGNTIYQLLEIHKSIPQKSEFTATPIPSYTFPQGIIKDSAILEYRGMHLDVSRHFFDIQFIKTYIDILALYKFNTFHWHLTDDQGWRIEIKKYPKLQEIGSYRKETMLAKNFQPYIGDQTPHKGFYTQKEIKEIIEYADKQHITIIPEIEMPGHSRAALAAYPEYSCKKHPLEPLTMWGVSEDVFCTSDSTFQFIFGILDEVIELFPSKTIHIGGDEVPKNRWKDCPQCQKIKENNHLENEEELQSYFIQRIDAYLTSKGRKIIGWDEILEGGLSPNAQVMSWRGIEGGIAAAKLKHYVVMTPGTHCYFDHYQGDRNLEPLAIGGYTPIEKVYQFEPIPSSLEPQHRPYILGAQGNVWTEYISTPEQVQYMILPRAAALSEVLWNVGNQPVATRNFHEFKERLLSHFEYYKYQNWNYAKSIYQIQSELFTDSQNTLNLKLTSHFSDRPIYYLYTPIHLPNNKNIPLGEGFTYNGPIQIKESCEIQALVMSNELLAPWVKKFHFNKATGKQIQLRKNPSKRYDIGGRLTLVDGILGSTPWTSKEWIGFLGDTLDAVIDLQSSTKLKTENTANSGSIKIYSDSVFVYFLSAPESWIHLPNKILIQTSSDGKQFKTIRSLKSKKFTNIQKSTGKFGFKLKSRHRYVRVIGEPQLSIPNGLPGSGEVAWLFVSEIQIN